MMKSTLMSVAAMIALWCVAHVGNASLLYDMEGNPPPSGFAPNGYPGPITQDTIGATQGLSSMKYEVPAGAKFVGALTTDIPAELSNPPGVLAILFDMTIDADDAFTGESAEIGVTTFGFKDGAFGLQNQFADSESIADKAPGTYADVVINLGEALNGPGAGKSFNDILADGDLDGITGFQLYISKSSDAPVTVYIDNIRSVVPEPDAIALLGLGAIVLLVAGSKARRGCRTR
ncbi:MAG: hypothetical protein AAF961_07135 [Planctomycetota bacterium]